MTAATDGGDPCRMAAETAFRAFYFEPFRFEARDARRDTYRSPSADPDTIFSAIERRSGSIQNRFGDPSYDGCSYFDILAIDLANEREFEHDAVLYRIAKATAESRTHLLSHPCRSGSVRSAAIIDFPGRIPCRTADDRPIMLL